MFGGDFSLDEVTRARVMLCEQNVNLTWFAFVIGVLMQPLCCVRTAAHTIEIFNDF